jgi:hypothetical protein
VHGSERVDGSAPIHLLDAAWKPRIRIKTIPTNKTPHWVLILQRFRRGETAAAIATSGGVKGQPVQLNSIIKHLLTALEHGEELNLHRLTAEMEGGAPMQQEWAAIAGAIATLKEDVHKDNFGKSKVMAKVYPAASAIPASVRDAHMKTKVKRWYASIDIFITLRRCRYDEATLFHPRHGACFPTEIYTRGCHWIPQVFASSEYACDQWHSSRESVALTVAITNHVETLKAYITC